MHVDAKFKKKLKDAVCFLPSNKDFFVLKYILNWKQLLNVKCLFLAVSFTSKGTYAFYFLLFLTNMILDVYIKQTFINWRCVEILPEREKPRLQPALNASFVSSTSSS